MDDCAGSKVSPPNSTDTKAEDCPIEYHKPEPVTNYLLSFIIVDLGADSPMPVSDDDAEILLQEMGMGTMRVCCVCMCVYMCILYKCFRAYRI